MVWNQLNSVKPMMFTDDLIVWRNKKEKVLEQLNDLEEVVKEYDMKFSIKKSEHMIMTYIITYTYVCQIIVQKCLKLALKTSDRFLQTLWLAGIQFLPC